MVEAVANLLKIDLGALACFSKEIVLIVSLKPPCDIIFLHVDKFLLTGEKGYIY